MKQAYILDQKRLGVAADVMIIDKSASAGIVCHIF